MPRRCAKRNQGLLRTPAEPSKEWPDDFDQVVGTLEMGSVPRVDLGYLRPNTGGEPVADLAKKGALCVPVTTITGMFIAANACSLGTYCSRGPNSSS